MINKLLKYIFAKAEYIICTIGLLYSISSHGFESCNYSFKSTDCQLDTKSRIDSLGNKAVHMFNEHNYLAADTLFSKYLRHIVQSEDIVIDDLNKLENKDDIGNKLYSYAFNSFFLGKEEEGIETLLLSCKCGNNQAYAAYNNLSESIAFFANNKLNYRTKKLINQDIREHDISFSKADSPSDFWNKLVSTNPVYQEYKRELNRKRLKGPIRNALYSLNASESSMKQRLEDCNPNMRGELENILSTYLYNSTNLIRDLRIYPSSYANAFATPYGDIYMTSSLVDRCLGSQQLLIGICAHEMTHYICKHSLIELWQTYKKEKSNRIWGGIVAGLYMTGMAAANIANTCNGYTSYNQSNYYDYGKTGNQLFTLIAGASPYYQFKYSRSQEIEADLAAYRFCEAIGIGGYSYIMALHLININTTGKMKAAKDSTHPSMSYRIELLRYLYNTEHQVRRR